MFADFGPQHIISDFDGSETKTSIVSYIEKGKLTIVDCDRNDTHGLRFGDWVKFFEVEGMSEINSCEKLKVIDIINDFSFRVDLDSTGFGEFLERGKV